MISIVHFDKSASRSALLPSIDMYLRSLRQPSAEHQCQHLVSTTQVQADIGAYPSAPAGPSTANGWSTTASSSAAYARPGPILADWKASPMWKPITAITNMEMLPEITAAENSHVRKERKITFTLSPDACEKMQQSKLVYTRSS